MARFFEVEGPIRDWAKGNPTIAPVVGSRVFFGVPTAYNQQPANSSAVYPFLVLYRSGGAPKGGPTPIDLPRITFDCWGDTKSQAANLAASVVDACEQLHGAAMGSLRAHTAEVVLGPFWQPDMESGKPRYIVDVVFVMRAAA